MPKDFCIRMVIFFDSTCLKKKEGMYLRRGDLIVYLSLGPLSVHDCGSVNIC